MKIITYEEFKAFAGYFVGAVTGMTNEEYHAHHAASKSALDLVAISPAHYAHGEKRKQTQAMKLGSAIHCAILEPELFASEYVMLRDITDRRSSEYKQAIKVHDPERVLIQSDSDRIVGISAAVEANKWFGRLKRVGSPGVYSELSVFAVDPETGTHVKCRFDYLDIVRAIAVDLKKTRDARPDKFSRSVMEYAYHVQHAFYTDVLMWADGPVLNEFVFVAVEETAPHTVKPYRLDLESVRKGRSDYRAALNTFAACTESGEWPGIDGSEPELIGLPVWAFDEEEIETEDNA